MNEQSPPELTAVDLSVTLEQLDTEIAELESFLAPYLDKLKDLKKRRRPKVAAKASAKSRADQVPASRVKQDREGIAGDRGHIQQLAVVHQRSPRTIHRKLSGR
ncbi:hypothetical protein N0B44_21040 [Roseibacterium beibuensis]|uniref:hypothetical protein n=1 Tax=[Roseibacterium] beibuensis TaxID=1193142 RepID=UPI00217D0546|nr:hypothetical protein [Roseibacterium beibuensis]MCS6625401.1 hypothetical protein [Roseibacterium beibuensis]